MIFVFTYLCLCHCRVSQDRYIYTFCLETNTMQTGIICSQDIALDLAEYVVVVFYVSVNYNLFSIPTVHKQAHPDTIHNTNLLSTIPSGLVAQLSNLNTS